MLSVKTKSQKDTYCVSPYIYIYIYIYIYMYIYVQKKAKLKLFKDMYI